MSPDFTSNINRARENAGARAHAKHPDNQKGLFSNHENPISKTFATQKWTANLQLIISIMLLKHRYRLTDQQADALIENYIEKPMAN
jgi:hypothetical protein